MSPCLSSFCAVFLNYLIELWPNSSCIIKASVDPPPFFPPISWESKWNSVLEGKELTNVGLTDSMVSSFHLLAIAWAEQEAIRLSEPAFFWMICLIRRFSIVRSILLMPLALGSGFPSRCSGDLVFQTLFKDPSLPILFKQYVHEDRTQLDWYFIEWRALPRPADFSEKKFLLILNFLFRVFSFSPRLIPRTFLH